MGMSTTVDFACGRRLPLLPIPRFAIVRRLPLVRRGILQKARMLSILGKQRFDFRPQPTVTRASLVEKRCPGLGRKFAYSTKQVGDLVVPFR